jgi:hypothetical protein
MRWRSLFVGILRGRGAPNAAHQSCAPTTAWHTHPRRCPANVPGPFYTLGTCLFCEAPEDEAPDLLAPLTGGNLTTHFVKQPETPEEVRRACRAAEVCCLCDLRYGGQDVTIINRLGNDPLYCDYVLRDDRLVLSELATATWEEFETYQGRKVVRHRQRWWRRLRGYIFRLWRQ